MDPITHCLVGGMAAKTTGTSKRRFWIMMFLGAAPDLDVVFSGFDHWAFWLQHRGITHSIFGVIVQALLYAWVLSKWDKGFYIERAYHYFLPLGLHALCDYFTSYGVPVFSPFQFHDYSADLMGAFAVIPIVFMSIGLLRLHKREMSGWNAARPLWAGWILYFAMSLSGKVYATKLAEAQHASLTAMPSIANPFVWSAISPNEANHSYDYYHVNLFEGVVHPQAKYPMPENGFFVQASMQSPLVEKYLKDARWPVARVSQNGDGAVVEWGQILFSTRGVVRGKLRIGINSKGQITSENKIFSFWNPPAA